MQQTVDFGGNYLRGGSKTGKNQTVAVIDVKQYIATFPG